MSSAAQDVQKHVKAYVVVFAALAALTVVTVAVGYLSLPIGAAVLVALAVATLKGSLVASFFMHLASEKKIIYWLLMLTFVLLLALFILFIVAFNDQWGELTHVA